jgi:nucleoside-diphosphate-sugar epimerase
MAESFFRSFSLPVTIVRPFNTYGPRQSARAVIPTIITQLLSGKKQIKLGALWPTRDLVFVGDTVEGFIEIAKSDKTIGEEVNIATNTEISVEDLAQKLIDQISPEAKIVTDDFRMRPEKSEVERLWGSNEKVQRLTNWKLTTTLDQGLRITIDWFKDPNNLSRYKADVYNI